MLQIVIEVAHEPIPRSDWILNPTVLLAPELLDERLDPNLFSTGIPCDYSAHLPAEFMREARYSFAWRISRPNSGVAKIDLFSTGTAAIEQDEATEQIYRQAASSKARSSRRREFDPSGEEPRFAPEAVESGPEDREQDAFLRARRRVPVRRGILPKTRTERIRLAAISLLTLASLIALGFAAHNFFRDDPRFRINSASYIQSVGNSQVTRAELLSVFGSDIGRNVFFVPLGERREELEQLPWVGRATVMRLLPNQLRVAVVERVPVAFVRSGDTIKLVDAHGVLLDMPPAMMQVKHYSFPVVTGISARDPLSVRAARMHFYQEFIDDLDSGGGKISQQLSEVDISDPEDIRALLPAKGSDILVHFGQGSFLERYKRYREHLAEWERQYPHLASADMRYDNQVVLEMAKGAGASSAAIGVDAQTGQPTAKSNLKTRRKANHGANDSANHGVAHGANHRVIHREHNQGRNQGPIEKRNPTRGEG